MAPENRTTEDRESLKISARLTSGCFVSFLLVSVLLLADLISDIGHRNAVVPRPALWLLGLGTGILSGLILPKGWAEDFYELLRAFVLIAILGILAWASTAFLMHLHCPKWLAIPVGIVLGCIVLLLIAFFGAGGHPFELVEPFCIIFLMVMLLLPVTYKLGQRVRPKRERQRLSAPASPAQSKLKTGKIDNAQAN
jgi:hypothetical protein